MLSLQEIALDDYDHEKERLLALVHSIWKGSSADNAVHSIERWASSRNESGEYFYIMQDNAPVGLTGYFIPDLAAGDFGLRHHGTTIKGTGKTALDLLVHHLEQKYGERFKRLIELVPEDHPEIITKFQSWGFVLSDRPVPSWEPKKYYKYVMMR